MKHLVWIVILFFVFADLAAQVKKSVEALYIDNPLTIDAVLDEPVYQQAQPAKDFVQLQPYNGRPSFQPTEAFFFYDQKAVYVGAMLYDSAPDSIFNIFTERDQWGMFDYFGVYLDPYNEGQLAFGFFISPAGVQFDIKATKSDGDYEDGNWNAVWESKTRITEKGWVVEMRIPYSALRFPDKEVHTWGLNMFRNIRRYNSNNSWSLVDRNVSGFIHQEGELTGIKNIKPPIRLSLSPYLATYMETRSDRTKPDFTYKGGMDLKYGLSESFTLDMMLIPDFGQIQSDDKELNLSPYELYYDEKRQFFTEGTELFQRADIFYSRRIGGKPIFSDNASSSLDSNEIVDYNPIETQLLNATKVSGRTSKGWGIGILNAMTLPSHAVLKDTLSGHTREVTTQPFTNYNVAVVDKSLKNNSYVSLINTNMVLANNPFMANVTATEFEIRNKAKTYALSGGAGYSIRGDTSREKGYAVVLGVEKNSGKFRFGISQSVFSDRVNPNDMGYLRRNNELRTEFDIGYHVFEPFWIVRETHINGWWNYARIYNPSDRYGHEIGIDWHTLFKNNYELEIFSNVETDRHDYYETRVAGRYFINPLYWSSGLYMSTDERKRISFYIVGGFFTKPSNDESGLSLEAGTNIRLGQRVQVSYDFNLDYAYNEPGFVDSSNYGKTIHFAKRDVKTLENVLELSYAMTRKAGISFRMRHYWSGADCLSYYLLRKDGSLLSDLTYPENHDQNYNAFNIDMVFRWIFAPGSELSLAWKNSIYSEQEKVVTDYFQNLDDTFNATQTNSISLKVLYYLDYNQLRRNKSKQQ
ncbi:MAG: carbohydrate binding family 9 domain-containing protein [Bacteroidales bacterium]|nr:carbohydrate binding family 9 domain-containing protein [Bacteroidales bacterium]